MPGRVAWLSHAGEHRRTCPVFCQADTSLNAVVVSKPCVGTGEAFCFIKVLVVEADPLLACSFSLSHHLRTALVLFGGSKFLLPQILGCMAVLASKMHTVIPAEGLLPPHTTKG